MDSAVLAMISTLFVLMVGNIWHQSRENAKTRDLIVRTNKETRSELRGDIKDLDNRVTTLATEVANLSGQFTESKRTNENAHVNLSGQLAEFKRTTENNHVELKRATENNHVELKRATEKNHNELRGSHAETRERLARIEGHLRIGVPPVETATLE